MYMEKENALEGRTFKETLAIEREKLKGMSLRKKCQYIWAYYKIIFVILLIIVAMISIGVTMYRNSKIEEVLYIAGVDSVISDDTMDYIEEFKERMELDDRYEAILLDTGYISDTESSEYGMSSAIKMTTMIAAQQMDVLFVPRETGDTYMEQGYFKDLREVLPEELLAEVEDLLVEGVNAETGETAAYGIRMEGNEKILPEEYFYGDDVVLSIVTNTEHLDMVISFIEYLVE